MIDTILLLGLGFIVGIAAFYIILLLSFGWGP